jgi:hypothetical protein
VCYAEHLLQAATFGCSDDWTAALECTVINITLFCEESEYSILNNICNLKLCALTLVEV